ncbi:DNA primase, partial [Streptomyces sp. TRM76130]|nr:DNA primase [Streptomyces sp. TRM76130]
FAVAVGTAVAGKRLNLTPRGVADLVSTQLRNNPQFLEIGDQLRQDLRGVGKAATGALVERQINGLADRLHGRTSQVRDQLSGVTSRVPGADLDDGRDGEYDDEPERHDERADDRQDERQQDERRDGPARRGGRTARKAADEAAPDAARKAPASASKAAAKKAAARKTPE